MTSKPRIAVHKFTSCDGCQLAFINLGEDLLALSEAVDFVHFAELGPVAPEAEVDVAFIEGSISTPEEIKRIQQIRANTQYLITIGACATAGGIQALRNFSDKEQWMQAIYAKPDTIKTLKTSTAIAEHVKVDFELWGCPVNGKQILDTIKALLQSVAPHTRRDSVCMECKRRGYTCVLVTQDASCMGPVTQTGCGALCPGALRDCYACYGPNDNPNTSSLAKLFSNQGLSAEAIARRFLFINSQAPCFKKAGLNAKKN
jgi:coenzyme F420-reducing hydrogenase gamma subunit